MIEDEDYRPEITRRRTPAVPLEGDITELCLTWANAEPQTFARKRHTGPLEETGHPDIEGCRQGFCFQVEMKRPGRKPTTKQMARLLRWRAAGATVGWATSLDEFRAIVERAGTGWVNPLTGPGASST